ncbi:hypothetical protein CANCADRAFT_31191 [Tortispora caseinolytica NRRL Y-17796]|uniref:Uncharacterized protein n=1 Tax=Tortispora caseinolytica NRRL Y-17796 TaxID=767744 RepID=A0A1E4TEE8_9ASCO|nr:hypothetical protein CANCADRAFT_31191 [Tortispora caseinolytica NRRL Y-17796]
MLCAFVTEMQIVQRNTSFNTLGICQPTPAYKLITLDYLSDRDAIKGSESYLLNRTADSSDRVKGFVSYRFDEEKLVEDS